MQTLNDEELAILVREEDSLEAFNELLRRYTPVIYGVAGKIFYSDNIQHSFKSDAILEGESALGSAIASYDRNEGTFKGYAVRYIEGMIKNYVNGNRSLIKPLALQRRLQTVKSAIRAVTDRRNSDIDISSVRAWLLQNYPDEAAYWNKSLGDYIIDVSDVRDDMAIDALTKNGMSLHEVVTDGKATDGSIERRESAVEISGILMDAWLEVTRKEIINGNKRGLKILYRYYVKGDSAEEIIHWLEGLGLNGCVLFRQAKSRGFGNLCKKYKLIFRNMVANINKAFDHVFVAEKAESFCDELKVFLQTLADTGILTEGYNAQS
ncbi:MAG: hypothetical protein VST72_01180 [Nitrospirota bacterium]|nr:hypothetical protein [Nitrospirota bacterium]